MSDGNLWIGLYPASAAATLLAQNEPGAESAERLHSTLAFFGKRSAADTEWIARIIAPLAAAQPPVDARLGEIERFGPAAQPVSAVCLHAPELAELRRALDAALPAELAADATWPYAPHLTLGEALAEPLVLPAQIRLVELRLVLAGEPYAIFPLGG